MKRDSHKIAAENPRAELEPMYSTAESAAVFGLSVRTLEDMRLRRVGPAWVKLGKAVRYRKSDLERYIARNTFTPAAND